MSMSDRLHENASLRKKIAAFLSAVGAGTATETASAATVEDGDSVRALNHIFDITDDLQDVLQELLHGWEPPQVVVIGRENTGKSTILERLCMLPMFPHESKVCTRMAIRVKVGPPLCIFCCCDLPLTRPSCGRFVDQQCLCHRF